MKKLNAVGQKTNEKEMKQATINSAKRRNAKAQFNLGVMYYEGQGVDQDYKEAVVCFRKAAEQGIAQVQYNLEQMYRKGKGIA